MFRSEVVSQVVLYLGIEQAQVAVVDLSLGLQFTSSISMLVESSLFEVSSNGSHRFLDLFKPWSKCVMKVTLWVR